MVVGTFPQCTRVIGGGAAGECRLTCPWSGPQRRYTCLEAERRACAASDAQRHYAIPRCGLPRRNSLNCSNARAATACRPAGCICRRTGARGQADTPAYVIDDGGEFEYVEGEAAERGYASTIDNQTLEDVVRGVHEVLKADSFAARLEALIYYQRFDAFLPHIGAPDPPPWEETRERLDREFYDSLGLERPERPVPVGRMRARGREAKRILQGASFRAGTEATMPFQGLISMRPGYHRALQRTDRAKRSL